jgi:hypothetical protein
VLYSPSRGVAFLHIHKTGGESLRHVLQSAIPDLSHMPELPEAHHPLPALFRALEDRGEDPSNCRVVTTVCHPKAHAVSVYEYWRSDRIPPEDRRLPHVARTRELDFSGFLTEVLVRDQFAEHLLVDGEVPPNVTILRRESLASGAADFLARALGRRRVRVDMPRLNRTEHAPVESYFDRESTERLIDSYDWTFGSGLYDPAVLPEEGDAGVGRRPRRAGLLGRGR